MELGHFRPQRGALKEARRDESSMWQQGEVTTGPRIPSPRGQNCLTQPGYGRWSCSGILLSHLIPELGVTVTPWDVLALLLLTPEVSLL